MLLNSNEFHKVEGEIYKITNLVTGKSYVGQTRSHRLNHGLLWENLKQQNKLKKEQELL